MRLVLATCILLAAAACGVMATGDYGAAVQDLGRDYEEETTELQRSLEVDLQREIDQLGRGLDPSDEEAIARYAEEAIAVTALRTKSFFAAVGDALSRYRTALAALEPPGAVAVEHDELLAAMDAALAGLPGLVAGLEEVEDFDAIDVAVNGSGFTDAGPRLRAACLGLQDGLAAEDVAVDLRCPA